MPIDVVGAPTVREPDGLAMSSRNQYLSAAERRIAPVLYRVLSRAAERVARHDGSHHEIETDAIGSLADHGFVPDYVAIRNADDLATAAGGGGDRVILAAARLGKARLIDNVRVYEP